MIILRFKLNNNGASNNIIMTVTEIKLAKNAPNTSNVCIKCVVKFTKL